MVAGSVQVSLANGEIKKDRVPFGRIKMLSELDRQVKSLLTDDHPLYERYTSIKRKGCASSFEICENMEKELREILVELERVECRKDYDGP